MAIHSLRYKLIAPFVAGALLLTIALAWYTTISARREIHDAALSIAAAKTNHAASTMGILFKSMNMALYNMVSDPHVAVLFADDDPSPQTLAATTDWIDIVVRSNEYYRDLYIVDKNGRCLVSSNPGFVGEDKSNLPHVRKALQGHFNMDDPAVGRVTKKFSLTMAGPVDAGGEVVGALVIVNDFPNIVGYGQKTDYDSQTVFLAMLAPDGSFPAHIDNALMGNRNAVFPELYQQLVSVREHGGAVYYTLKGETYMGYAKVEPNTKWIVVSSGREDDVLASATRMGLVVTVISCVFLCLITFVVVRFATDILNAMFSLIAYAKAVSEGDLDRQLEATKRRDELGILHTALLRMVTTLRHILDETQKASEMKGQFLANMSHEIRTPLNAIMGMTHLMLREDTLAGKLRDFTDKIRISSMALFGLINDILDLSKVEAGMIELEDIPFDLKEVVDNALVIHQENARHKGLVLALDWADDLPRRFVGDGLRIGQVLNNLLSNAIKFTQHGGVTVACTREAALSEPASADGTTGELLGVRVSVTDTGMGIAEDMIDKLFTPFTQADASITRQFGGTGLGLAISRKLVELLGGQFSITSTLGTGTTLSFTMRLKPAAEGAATHGDDTLMGLDHLRLDGKSLLVVEDNSINQLIMEELLLPLGCAVKLADNGQEAVDFVQAETFDLIFMDVQMPVLDGLEATRRIRALKGPDTPIIALTANAMKEDRERCLAAGMNAYITKPVEPQALAEMLREWIR